MSEFKSDDGLVFYSNSGERLEAIRHRLGLPEFTDEERKEIPVLADQFNQGLSRFPVVFALAVNNNTQLEFWCKFCKAYHLHGRHGGQGHVDAENRYDAEQGWFPRIDAVLPVRRWKRYLQRFSECRYDLWSPLRRKAMCTCPAGSGDGHRAPHCSNREPGRYYEHGYILYEVPPGDPRATRAPRPRRVK